MYKIRSLETCKTTDFQTNNRDIFYILYKIIHISI